MQHQTPGTSRKDVETVGFSSRLWVTITHQRTTGVNVFALGAVRPFAGPHCVSDVIELTRLVEHGAVEA